MLENFSKQQRSKNPPRSASSGGNELELALSIADILDELNMLLLLIETQSSVIASIHRGMFQLRPPKSQDKNVAHHIAVKDTSMGDIRLTAPNVTLWFDNAEVGSLDVNYLGNTSVPKVEEIGGILGVFVRETEEGLRLERSNLKRLHQEATQTHQMARPPKLINPTLCTM